MNHDQTYTFGQLNAPAIVIIHCEGANREDGDGRENTCINLHNARPRQRKGKQWKENVSTLYKSVVVVAIIVVYMCIMNGYIGQIFCTIKLSV